MLTVVCTRSHDTDYAGHERRRARVADGEDEGAGVERVLGLGGLALVHCSKVK